MAPTPEPRLPPMPPSARPSVDSIDDVAHPRSRTPPALHPSEGEADLKVKQNGQVKALSCVFYVATSRAGQNVHVLWNERSLQIFDDDGEHIIDYPRPAVTGFYYGPRTPRGTAMKGAGHNPSAGSIGTAVRTVSRGC